MVVNNCKATPPTLKAFINQDDKNQFLSAIKAKGRTMQEVLHQAAVKCISDTDNFLSYIYGEE